MSRNIKIVEKELNDELNKLPFYHPVHRLCREYNNVINEHLEELNNKLIVIENDIKLLSKIPKL